MPHTWTGSDDRRAEFAARGWLILRGVVSDQDLGKLNRIFDEVMAASAAAPGASGSAVSLRPNAGRAHAAMLRHLHEGVAEIAGQILGAPSVRLLQDALLMKRPSANGSIALHQDYTYTGFLDPPAIVSVGLALNDASAESGCLHVVDASHTWGLVGGFQILGGKLQNDISRLLSPAQRESVHRERIPLEVRAGDVTIHHCLTLHGSDSNRSRGPRKTIVTHLFSGDCRIVRDRLPRAHRHHFSTDDDGHLTAPAFPKLYPTDRSSPKDGHLRRRRAGAPRLR
jgi:ectoine hydroxylase-related dioxygenase (phytanoyl-CoA dioxygenase family)